MVRPSCKLIRLQADKHEEKKNGEKKLSNSVTEIRDYNRHSSNNIMPRLLRVDETVISDPVWF